MLNVYFILSFFAEAANQDIGCRMVLDGRQLCIRNRTEISFSEAIEQLSDGNNSCSPAV